MEHFINEMKNKNIPLYAINLISLSYEWQQKFKYFNNQDLQQMIHFYPTFYKNVIKPLNTTTENELYMLTDQLNSIKI
jgi:hypothetical protein